MGLDVYMIVGPYAKCKGEPQKVPGEVWTCLNEQCKAYDGPYIGHNTPPQFCFKCGSNCGKRMTMVKQDRYELATSAGFRYARDEGNVQTYFYDAKREGGDCYTWVREIKSVIEPQSEINAFKERCSNGITKLYDAYGPENVSFGYGVIQHVSV